MYKFRNNVGFETTDKMVLLMLGISVFLSPIMNITLWLVIYGYLILRRKENQIIQLNNIFQYYFICIIAINIAGIFVAFDKNRCIKEIGSYLLYFFVYIIFSKIRIGKSKEYITKFYVKLTYVICLFQILKIFFGFFKQRNAFVSFPDTNFIGMILLVIGIFAYILLDSTDIKMSKYIYILVVFSTLIIITGRGALGVLLILIIIYESNKILKEKKINLKIFLWSILGIGLFLTIDNPIRNELLSQMSSVFDNTHYSNNIRLYIWEDIINNIVPNHFWIGVGGGNLNNIFPLYSTIDFIVWHAHSIYLNILAENGVIGLGVFIGFFIYIIRFFKKEISHQSIAIAGLYSIIAFLGYGVVETGISDSRVGIIVFSIIGITYNFVSSQKKLKFNK